MLRFSTLALCSVLPALSAMPPAPRPAPELVIQPPGGPQTLLSGYRGKVVALELIHTTCPHCQRSCQAMSRLYAEFGKDGFQPLAVAWNDMAAALIPSFVRANRVNYPVGACDRLTALEFMGFSPSERVVVPQILWIDRKGVIRSQTPPLGDEAKLKEEYWRETLKTLLAETGPAGNPARKSKAAHKAVLR